MRAARQLATLANIADRRALKLRELVLHVATQGPVARDRLGSYITFETANIWAGFCRSFYLSCAAGAWRVNGTRVTLANLPRLPVPEALRHANKFHRGAAALPAPKPWWTHLDEPAWHRTTRFRGALQQLAPSNMAVVTASLTGQAASIEQLFAARNFFAHRSLETSTEVAGVALAFGLPPDLHPRDVIFATAPTRPQPILADWVDDMRTIAAMMCEI